MRVSLVILSSSLLLFKFVLGVATDTSSPTNPGTQDIQRKIDELQNQALQKILAGLDADEGAAKAAGKKPNCTRKLLRRRVEL